MTLRRNQLPIADSQQLDMLSGHDKYFRTKDGDIGNTIAVFP